MRIISRLTYWLCVIIVAIIALLAWTLIGWQIGLAGVIGTLAFIVAYRLSGKIVISRRDKYVRSEWGVFAKKLAWAWSAALIVYGLAYIVIAYHFGDVIDVMPK